MEIWSSVELFYIFIIFLWTGFVRTGLGFGGAALGLPLLLLVGESPLYWLPLIGAHLLFFTTLTFTQNKLNKAQQTIDTGFIKKYLPWILIPTLIGVFGLITFSKTALTIFVYSVAMFYSLIWIFGKEFKSTNTFIDKFLLVVGGYVAGISLTGAPLIVAVAMRYVAKHSLRSTLFVLWFILVGIKMLTFVILDIPIDIIFALILLPIAFIGHLIGLKVHTYIIKNDAVFKKAIGTTLLVISVFGLIKLI